MAGSAWLGTVAKNASSRPRSLRIVFARLCAFDQAVYSARTSASGLSVGSTWAWAGAETGTATGAAHGTATGAAGNDGTVLPTGEPPYRDCASSICRRSRRSLATFLLVVFRLSRTRRPSSRNWIHQIRPRRMSVTT